MLHTKLVGLGLVATVALFAVSPAVASPAKLTGTVGPEDTITLTAGGHKVASLTAGRYALVVQDLATDHDFHLTGPGVNKLTSVGGTGRTVWSLTLKKGTYRYVCDPHASYMKGSFLVR